MAQENKCVRIPDPVCAQQKIYQKEKEQMGWEEEILQNHFQTEKRKEVLHPRPRLPEKIRQKTVWQVE